MPVSDNAATIRAAAHSASCREVIISVLSLSSFAPAFTAAGSRKKAAVSSGFFYQTFLSGFFCFGLVFNHGNIQPDHVVNIFHRGN